MLDWKTSVFLTLYFYLVTFASNVSLINVDLDENVDLDVELEEDADRSVELEEDADKMLN